MSGYERTGWRDESISRRHRIWGFNCPCVDLDFLVVEYNIGKPVGLIEYKHYKAQKPNLQHATYRALAALADGYTESPLPFLIAFYWPEIWAFQVYPVNECAKGHFYDGDMLTEKDFVSRLYHMRSLVLTENLMKHLQTLLPEEEEPCISGPLPEVLKHSPIFKDVKFKQDNTK